MEMRWINQFSADANKLGIVCIDAFIGHWSKGRKGPADWKRSWSGWIGGAFQSGRIWKRITAALSCSHHANYGNAPTPIGHHFWLSLGQQLTIQPNSLKRCRPKTFSFLLLSFFRKIWISKSTKTQNTWGVVQTKMAATARRPLN